MVFAPQVRISLAELRAKVPKRYPIRHYPDITHSLQSQYPVPDWDVAYAVTEGREVINPRPMDEAAIFHRMQPYTIGFLTYSEGCNDDVNKFIWSALGWDPDANVPDILRQYSRYFIGDEYEDSFAQGLLALERNWRGPLAANARRLHDARAISDHGARFVARDPAELAIPAGAVSRLLRCLRAAETVERDRTRRIRHGSIAFRENDRERSRPWSGRARFWTAPS